MLQIHDLIEDTRRRHFGDSRVSLDEIRVEHRPEAVRVFGHVLDAQAGAHFMQALRSQAPTIEWRDDLTPLIEGPDYSWALNLRAVADLRREPRNSAERVTQALYGEPIEVLRYQDDWAFVRLSDGYLGWMHVEPLHICTSEWAHLYRQQATQRVRHPLAPCYVHPSGAAHEQCALLPFGAPIVADRADGTLQRIRWPDGTWRWVPATDLLPQHEIAHGSTAGLRQIMPWLERLIGVPYLWGGKTPFGIDCSGLMQVIFGLVGVPLRRDADQQAQSGSPVAFAELSFGDLIFFDTRTPKAEILSGPPAQEITHVALALSRTEFIHSSWRGGGVIWGSFDPKSPFFTPTYDRRFLSARRYLQQDH